MLVSTVKVFIAQSCLTLCNPMDCSPSGASVHGILQARILEWGAIPFSRGSSQPTDQTQISSIVGRCYNLWATREASVRVYILKITVNVNGINTLTKTQAGWMNKKTRPICALYRRPASDLGTHSDWKWWDGKNIPYKWKSKWSSNAHIR